MQLPNRSTLATGLVGLLGWGIVKYAIPLACAAAGGIGAIVCGIAANISVPEAIAGITAAATMASHFTPDSIKDVAKSLNVDVQKLAAIMPTAEDTSPSENSKGQGL